MPRAIAIHQDLIFKDISAIIFDKDGTLEDSLSFWREVGIQRARAINAQIPGVGEPLLLAFGIRDSRLEPTGLMAVGNRWENEIAAAAYIAETGRSWHQAKQIARSAFDQVASSQYLVKNATSAPLFPEVTKLLASLHGAKIKLGILSADSTRSVVKFVSNHNLQDYIQLALGSDGELRKPDPQLYIQACQNLGVLPEQTLMVGDALGDIEMAQRAGAAGTIGVVRSPQLSLTTATSQISSLAAIQILSS